MGAAEYARKVKGYVSGGTAAFSTDKYPSGRLAASAWTGAYVFVIFTAGGNWGAAASRSKRNAYAARLRSWT